MYCILALIVTCITAPILHAQTKLSEFEVATVKPSSHADIQGFVTYPGGRMLIGNESLVALIANAFNMQDHQVVSSETWMKADAYTITALSPGNSGSPAVSKVMTLEQREMLQALLRDRFNLKYHAETRSEPVFLLEHGKGTLKLAEPKDRNAQPFVRVNITSTGERDGELIGTNTTMDYAAYRLSQVLHRTVINRTGLPGAYDFHVDSPDAVDTERSSEYLMNAVLEGMKRLGLKLKLGKSPIEIIVIDSAVRPDAN